jgi:WD40 repeat protein
MKKLHVAFLVLASGLLSGLTLVASAGGTTATDSAQIRHLKVPVEALAIDGNQIAYDAGSALGKADNKVLVWNIRTGKTTRVSGAHTDKADGTSTGSGVFELAIAGSRVAWIVNLGGNTEGQDYVYASSVSKPKERMVWTTFRFGDSCPGREQSNCTGPWLGGLVGSGNLIALNRWRTDSGSVTRGELDVLSGTKMKQVATGAATVEAASVDGGRVAVLRSDGTVGVYSSAGKLLRTVSPSSAEALALSGHNLVVLTKTRTLELYDTRTGALKKTLSVHGAAKTPVNLDVQGNIAIYTTGSLHAVNLSSGKDRVIGTLRGGVGLARMSTAGVVYSTVRSRSKGTLVFLPSGRVAAAVAG